ncbi:bacteriophage replication protein [Escherichia coli DEC10B]|nr:bacteriophage replication protein [Escherichia coli DEC10B]
MEYVDGSKGTPTSYIATYIGKNLDSRAVDGIDPKTGKPRVDHETGKSMAEGVERAIGWARLHRVRQFQSLASPPVRYGVNSAPCQPDGTQPRKAHNG